MAKSDKAVSFKTHYDAMSEHKRFHCSSGQREKLTYQPVFDRAGVWHLEENGKTNVYLDIQSYADSCDINVIMARYRNGETDVLSKIQGTYGDFSNIPRNYADLMNAKIEAENLFMSLAAPVRERYNNSVEQFMSEIGTRAGLEKLGVSFDAPKQSESVVVAESEVKANE